MRPFLKPKSAPNYKPSWDSLDDDLLGVFRLWGPLITVMWARGGAKRRWLFSYISYAAHLSQEKGNEITVSIISFLALSGVTILDSVGFGPSFRFMWAAVPFNVGHHYGDVGTVVVGSYHL